MMTVEVWEPAYSNKSGVKKLSGTMDMDGLFFRRTGYYGRRELGVDVFRTREEAREEAEKRRVERIASLDKQLAKLRSLNHESTLPA